jgi:predicted transposase/invertase (TIGR01784 family)
MEKGIQQGIKEGVLKIAQNLIKSWLENEFISNATGLSLDEINKIKKEFLDY